MTWCVTENGAVEQFVIPGGSNLISREGYAVCASYGEYWVLGEEDSGNWQSSVISQPNGPNSLPLTISRTSTDGKVVLNHVFTWVNNFKTLGIKTKGAFNGYYIRYAELDSASNLANHTSSSGFAWKEGESGLLQKPNPPVALSSVSQGGSLNPCQMSPRNSNQVLMLKWAVFSPIKNGLYFEYSAIR